MLKLIDTRESFNKSKMKCAEVFCHSDEQFSIVCEQCEMKTFDFTDFWTHFKAMHLKVIPATGIEEHEQKIKEEHEQSIEAHMHTYNMVIKPDVAVYSGEEDNDMIEPKTDNQVDALAVTNEETDNNCNNNVEDSPSENSYEDMTTEDEDDAYGDDDDNEEYIPKILSRKTRSSSTKKPRNDSCDKNDNYSCKDCNKVYKSEKSLVAHIDKKHDPTNAENNLKCTYCTQIFKESRDLKLHVSNEHRTFPCPDCNRVYKSNHLLRLHLYSHSGERRFKCDHENCDKAFFNPKLLSSHKRMVHVLPANFVCEMCGYRTKSNSVLEVHKRSHTGEKPCICKTCGKGFASQSLLSEHQPIHSTERPYSCDVCGASFSRPKALYHHKHLHLGIKKFVCKICGKAYAQAAGLSGHMRHHKAELSMT